MQLVSFSVQNFRSITKAHKLLLGGSTILIGPNNEGKSNLLRAMVTGLKLLRLPKERPDWSATERAINAQSRRQIYDWERDFPIPLQGTKPDGESVFLLEFELSSDEVETFRTEIRSQINGTLPIEVSIGKKQIKIRVRKKGPGAEALSAKQANIAKFVAQRVDIQYIPAVRTAESAIEVIDHLVSRELRQLEKDADFMAAIGALAQHQKPLLDKLSSSIQQTLAVFLPDVKRVTIDISSEATFRALRRSTEILIDDGIETELKYKGDGVQSLAALALTRHMSESGSLGKNILIAIEEPEAHLHPKAIHQIRAVLRELAAKHRLVIATHCPLFVDRSDITNNILVTDNRARPAKTIKELRDTLGVRASDNLQHAELVLLVEGVDDKIALDALLRQASSLLSNSLNEGTLAIDEVGGASNYTYKAGLIRDALCDIHLFLDADDAGKRGAESVRLQGIASDAEINFSSCIGMKESELEDLYSIEAYKDVVARLFGVRIDVPAFKGNQKWSERMRHIFQRQGKMWDERVKMRTKQAVAEAIAANPKSALEQGRSDSFHALVRQLESRLGSTA